jgi:predicted aldo/keto reductase-like oxidoreductase
MKYRSFGRTGWQVSVLGLGCMRLPTLGSHEEVNEPEAIRLIRHAIDGGVNYLDSAWGYHGKQSEIVLGKALAGGYRDRVKLVTKMPTWKVNSAADFEGFLTEQLGKLQTDRIDLYLLHGLGKDGWHKVRDFGVLEWADRAIASGRIGHLGFSFHDEYDVLKEIVDAWDRWTACMVQYNYMFTETQAGTKGVKYAASKGLAWWRWSPSTAATSPPRRLRCAPSWTGAARGDRPWTGRSSGCGTRSR